MHSPQKTPLAAEARFVPLLGSGRGSEEVPLVLTALDEGAVGAFTAGRHGDGDRLRCLCTWVHDGNHDAVLELDGTPVAARQHFDWHRVSVLLADPDAHRQAGQVHAALRELFSAEDVIRREQHGEIAGLRTRILERLARHVR